MRPNKAFWSKTTIQSCGEAVKLDRANVNSYLVKVFCVGVIMKISENTTGISCISLVPSAGTDLFGLQSANIN